MTCIWRPLRILRPRSVAHKKWGLIKFQMSHECQVNELGILLNNNTLYVQQKVFWLVNWSKLGCIKKHQNQKIKLRQSLVVSRIYKKSWIWFSFMTKLKAMSTLRKPSIGTSRNIALNSLGPKLPSSMTIWSPEIPPQKKSNKNEGHFARIAFCQLNSFLNWSMLKSPDKIKSNLASLQKTFKLRDILLMLQVFVPSTVRHWN